jgi:hypothetical protein
MQVPVTGLQMVGPEEQAFVPVHLKVTHSHNLPQFTDDYPQSGD